MPRVTHVKAARKDNPVCKKGESYYWWKFRYGGKRYSLKRPRASQLTQSAYFGGIRSLMEQIDDTDISSNDDFVSLRDEVAEEIGNIGSECQDSLDNMPDSLQYSPTGEMLQERIDACENAQSEIECAEEFDDDEPEQSDFAGDTEECESCEGNGYIGAEEDEDTCCDCNGDGTVEDDGEEDYNAAQSEWEEDQQSFIDGCKDELQEAVANCEV